MKSIFIILKVGLLVPFLSSCHFYGSQADEVEIPFRPSVSEFGGDEGGGSESFVEHGDEGDTEIEPELRGDGVPVAVGVDGMPGYVLNPWTKEVVDVRGLPSGTKVKDPSDPDGGHLFRVP